MKLRIEAFRGVNTPVELTINTRRALTVLYGENGSGKTTISDALEFVFHGLPGSLDEKSLDGKTKLPALVHAARQSKDLKVSWTEGPSERIAKLIGGKAAMSGAAPATKLRTLRRNLITSLIEETPANRFQRIRSFVELPALDREEQSLTDFIKQHKDSLRTQEAFVFARGEELVSLHADVFADAPKKPSVESWAKEVAGAGEYATAESIEIIKDIDHHIASLRNDFKSLDGAYSEVTGAANKATEDEQRLKTLSAQQANQMAGAIDLLEEAAKFLDSQSVAHCPVCDTPQTPEALKAAVSAKLFELKEVSAQNAKLTAAKKELSQKQASLEALQGRYFDHIRLLCAAHGAAAETRTGAVPVLSSFLTGPVSAKDLTYDWFSGFKKAASELKPLGDWAASELTRLQKNQTLKDRLQKLLHDRTKAKQEYQELSQLIAKAEGVLEVFRSERTRYADAALGAISGDFARLYKAIHPGEKIEKIRLYLHPDRKGSALLSGELHGKEEASPVAYLSESHLDTLGLCLFLALEKRNHPADTLLFLDDAIASVDEAHMERLYETIVEEAQHFKHVLITSHYQPLRYKFKWGQLTRQNIEFIELGEWSLEEGICFDKGCESQIELLRQRLRERNDPQGIAAKSGVILEYLFDFITGIYRCKLPRLVGGGQGWTLHEYKEALEGNKKLFAALKAEHLDENGTISKEVPLKPLFEDLFTQFAMRSILGAHFNKLASHFNSIAEAVRLGEAVLTLVDALCDADHQLPESNKNGSCWTNRGETKTRRLHPLLPPQ